MTQDFMYDHPAYNAPMLGGPSVIGAGTTTFGEMYSVAARTVKAFNLRVRTAGTAAGFVVALMAGTATIGVCTLGTNTAGYETSVSVATASRSVAASTTLAFKVIGDATGVAVGTYEYNFTADGDFPS